MPVDFHHDAVYDKPSDISARRQNADTMVDISQQIAYWRNGAEQDLEVAEQTLAEVIHVFVIPHSMRNPVVKHSGFLPSQE